MRRFAQIGLLTAGVGLGLVATLVLLSTLAVGATNGLVDLAVRAMAPKQVDVDSTYVVNVSYANKGWVPAPDNWVRVTLPEGTEYVKATYPGGEPRPPDEVDDLILTWNVRPLVANSTWGHIMVEIETDEGLAEGTILDVVAEIGGSAEDSDTENNTATATSTVQDMGGSMKRVRTRQAMPADVIEYTITVDLPGQGGAGARKQWVTLTDTLPARHQVRFLGWVGSPSGTLTEGHKLRWRGEVTPGEPVQLRYRLGVEGDVPPGTVISNAASLGWHGRRLRLGPVGTVISVPHGVMGVGPGQGGQVQHRYGVTLDVPPGAVDESTRFEVTPLDTDKRPITPPPGLYYAKRAFEVNAFRFGEPIRQFNAPLTITARYSEANAIGLKRETLRLWTREGPEGPWKRMGEPVRTMSGTLAHATTHLSEFALFGELDPAAGQVDLIVRGTAPALVDTDSTYVVNVSYANKGRVASPDNWVRVTLPAGTEFVEATYAGGEPRPPDEIDGQVLTWNPRPLVAASTWGHIMVEVKTDKNLAEGTTLDVLAEIGGSAPDANINNNEITITSAVQDMGGAMKRVHVRQVMPADVLEYTITVDLPSQGGGGGGKQWVTLTDTLPARHQARFLGWVGSPSGVLTEGHKLRWQGEVTPGEPVQLRYRLGVEGDVPPGTAISNVATLGWHGRQMQLGPVGTVVSVPHGALGVGPGQGGQVAHRYGVTLTVPPGAVRDSTRFQVGPLDTEQPITAPNGLQYAHRAFEVNAFRFGEPVRQFNAPLTIAVRYSDEDVAGLKRETLRLWTREGPEGPWKRMGEPVRAMSGTLEHTTTHLSEFALFGEVESSAPVDLAVRAVAPAQVVAGTAYVANVSYSNQGWVQGHDNWVRVTLPADAQFVRATYAGGGARPPDVIQGRVLTWNLPLLVANSTWGHIMVELKADAGLAGGTKLEVVAEIGGTEDDSDLDNNTDTATSTVKGSVTEPPYHVYLPFVIVQ